MSRVFGKPCALCGKPITDYPYTIRDGKFYHSACEAKLPRPKGTIIARIARDLIERIASAQASMHLPAVKAKYSREISDYGITDDEIIEEVRRRLAR